MLLDVTLTYSLLLFHIYSIIYFIIKVLRQTIN